MTERDREAIQPHSVEYYDRLAGLGLGELVLRATEYPSLAEHDPAAFDESCRMSESIIDGLSGQDKANFFMMPHLLNPDDRTLLQTHLAERDPELRGWIEIIRERAKSAETEKQEDEHDLRKVAAQVVAAGIQIAKDNSGKKEIFTDKRSGLSGLEYIRVPLTSSLDGKQIDFDLQVNAHDLDDEAAMQSVDLVLLQQEEDFDPQNIAFPAYYKQSINQASNLIYMQTKKGFNQFAKQAEVISVVFSRSVYRKQIIGQKGVPLKWGPSHMRSFPVYKPEDLPTEIDVEATIMQIKSAELREYYEMLSSARSRQD